nr:uncharacterized protein LOC103443722 [Malus domestica]
MHYIANHEKPWKIILSPQHQKTVLQRLPPFHPEAKKIGSGIDYITTWLLLGFHYFLKNGRRSQSTPPNIGKDCIFDLNCMFIICSTFMGFTLSKSQCDFTRY